MGTDDTRGTRPVRWPLTARWYFVPLLGVYAALWLGARRGPHTGHALRDAVVGALSMPVLVSVACGVAAGYAVQRWLTPRLFGAAPGDDADGVVRSRRRRRDAGPPRG